MCAQYRVRGEKRHGPYWFRFWREGGRLRKQYVRAEEFENTRLACERHRLARATTAMQRRKRKAERRSTAELLRESNMLLKEVFGH